MAGWVTEHIIEIFGAVTGIIYVFLEIRQNIFLWPLGIITSAVYIYVFRENGFYAGTVLQLYYLVISVYGWWAWRHGGSPSFRRRRRGGGLYGAVEQRAESREKGAEAGRKKRSQSTGGRKENTSDKQVRRLDMKTALWCLTAIVVLWIGLWAALAEWTDSPVPLWDGLITSLSIVATWMLTRKILEQWYVWIFANALASIVYLAVGMYPTTVLFIIYGVMAVAGLKEWKKMGLITNTQG